MASKLSAKRDLSKGDLANIRPKLPRRARGKQRVAQLLEAGAAVFVEKGFDLATMTEIAERAGASIGSLYQFFPSKESMADTLRAQFGATLCERVAELRSDAGSRSATELADLLFEIDIDVLEQHPAFAVLAVTRGRTSAEMVSVRERLADEVLALFALHAPHVPAAQLREIVIVVRHIMRATLELIVESGGQERDRTLGVEEMKYVLREYLCSRLEARKS